jgi:hypothetical protein
MLLVCQWMRVWPLNVNAARVKFDRQHFCDFGRHA